MKKKKVLSYNYICREIRLSRIMLDEIHQYHIKHSKTNNLNQLMIANKSAKYKYFVEELYPLIVVYKTKYQNKFIPFPRF